MPKTEWRDLIEIDGQYIELKSYSLMYRKMMDILLICRVSVSVTICVKAQDG